MDVLRFAQQRVKAFLDEVERLSGAEFPHEHSSTALDRLRDRFRNHLNQLEQLTPESDSGVVKQQCRLVLDDLFTYLPLLGFILRSTNVRNAFEVFGPFLRLARVVLEPSVPAASGKTKLLLSSEWDFSPFTYPAIPALPGYLFIGLPAPESSNPLLLPLAGHELGHAVWLDRDLETQFRVRAKQCVIAAITDRWSEYVSIFGPLVSSASELTTNLLAVETWTRSVALCVCQAEETFCDFVGLRLFRESYLHSFCYLLSPNFGARSERYPDMSRRIENLLHASTRYSVAYDTEYQNSFDSSDPPQLSREDEFRLSIADEALKVLVPKLVLLADQEVRTAALPERNPDEIGRILKWFRRVTPAEGCQSVPDILNAAWLAYLDPNLWQNLPVIREKRDLVLKELTLKNLEIFEIEQIQKDPL